MIRHLIQHALDPYWSLAEGWIDQARISLPALFQNALPEMKARSYWEEDEDVRPYEMRGNTALLTLSGPLTKAYTWMMYYYGGTSTIAFGKALQQAMDDPAVQNVCITFDSPGGQVAGTSDLAALVAQAAAQKPVYAYVADQCCSAAYWIASQCEEIYGNQTAVVGSIGTYMTLVDSSKMYKEAGIEVKVIRAGEHKGAGLPGTKVTDEQEAEFQRVVNELNSHFVQAVKAGRDLEDEQMQALTDGRVHIGQAACDMGLMNGVCTLSDCLSMLQSAKTKPALW